ncbi:hypothetical protein HispidOSU_001122 [Sigmodon hispidus]
MQRLAQLLLWQRGSCGLSCAVQTWCTVRDPGTARSLEDASDGAGFGKHLWTCGFE